MDALDLKIIREMGIRPYGPRPQDIAAGEEAAIAKRLAIDLKTVKSRVARMEESGFLSGYQVVPNLGLLRLKATAYLYRIPDADGKAAALARVALVDGLLEVHDFLGTAACIDVTYASPHELASKVRLVSEFMRDPAPVRFYERHLPAVARDIGSLDWRLIQALRRRARRPLAEVADELGVTLKTVRRRFDRLAEEGSIFVAPMLDPSRASGLVLFELLVYTSPNAPTSTLGDVLRALDDNHVYHYVPASAALGNFDVLLFAQSVAQVEELRKRAKDVSGVARVDALLFQGWSDYSQWLDARIAERSAAAVPSQE